jgi:hypothetical protein
VVQKTEQLYRTQTTLARTLRVYLPPGYHEDTLTTYPVAFMQDGQNLALVSRGWRYGLDLLHLCSPSTTKPRGACACTCRCSRSVAWSHAPRGPVRR